MVNAKNTLRTWSWPSFTETPLQVVTDTLLACSAHMWSPIHRAKACKQHNNTWEEGGSSGWWKIRVQDHSEASQGATRREWWWIKSFEAFFFEWKQWAPSSKLSPLGGQRHLVATVRTAESYSKRWVTWSGYSWSRFTLVIFLYMQITNKGASMWYVRGTTHCRNPVKKSFFRTDKSCSLRSSYDENTRNVFNGWQEIH